MRFQRSRSYGLVLGAYRILRAALPKDDGDGSALNDQALTLDVLRPHSHADEACGNASQPGPAAHQVEDRRAASASGGRACSAPARGSAPSPGTIGRSWSGNRRRRCTLSRSLRARHAFLQHRRQQIRRGDRVLDRQIDADAADRRHRRAPRRRCIEARAAPSVRAGRP